MLCLRRPEPAIREDNKYLNKSITYSYDAGGNLTRKKEYPYTIETLGTPIRTINYTYGDSNWKDKLTAYDGKTITYDPIGNPLTYDGNTFAWTGRQLDSITNSNDSISYTYNADGIRTGKTVNGVTTKYFLHGDRITLEKVGNEERAFWYDGDGNAAAFVIYDAEGKHPYYYMRNGQGDIIGLFDVTGTVVARYTYDSWGKLVSITDGNGTDKTNDTTFVGYKNPLRYRGYYYDNETGLYYLQSRYYNPEWGRFLNADGIIGANGDVISNNLFTYCCDNPIILKDTTGYVVELIIFSGNISPFISFGKCNTVAWDNHGSSIQYTSSSLGGTLLPDAGASIVYSRYDCFEVLEDFLRYEASADINASAGYLVAGISVLKDNQITINIGSGISICPGNLGANYTKSKETLWSITNHVNNKTGMCCHSWGKRHRDCGLPPTMWRVDCKYCDYYYCWYGDDFYL